MEHAKTAHVIIVGAGFGGLSAARALDRGPVRVTVIDRENHHLFQPLLYQVATAGLAPGDIAVPIRSVLRKERHIRVIMGDVRSVDLAEKKLRLESDEELSYDWLVLAAGMRTNYFGHDTWAAAAPGLKSLRDALDLRERILLAFETAEREPDATTREALLTFVVIGAGPTGVEMAGAISELARTTLRRDFRRIDPQQVRVVLIEMADRVLTPFEPSLSESAKRQLGELEVDVRTSTRVTDVSSEGVTTDHGFIAARTVCWASGVAPVALTTSLGVPLHRGAVRVERDCSIKGFPEAFVIGDMAAFFPEGEEQALPGLCPVAMQQGRYVARTILGVIAGKPRKPFRYVDKGIMATIGRSRAVVQSGAMRVSGYVAWLMWLFVHLLFLVGYRNRLVVLASWAWSYLTFGRGARLITSREHSLALSITARDSRSRTPPPP